MNNLLLINLQVSLNDLIHEMQDFIFVGFVFYLLIEIATTKFCNDVSVIFGSVNLMQCEYIGHSLELFKDIDLRFEQSSIDLVFEHLHIDDFYCH